MTDRPARASQYAAAEPPGPPPTTRTSSLVTEAQARSPLNNACHSSRRPCITTRCVLGSAIPTRGVAKSRSLRLARLAVDMSNGITQQAPRCETEVTSRQSEVGHRASGIGRQSSVRETARSCWRLETRPCVATLPGRRVRRPAPRRRLGLGTVSAGPVRVRPRHDRPLLRHSHVALRRHAPRHGRCGGGR